MVDMSLVIGLTVLATVLNFTYLEQETYDPQLFVPVQVLRNESLSTTHITKDDPDFTLEKMTNYLANSQYKGTWVSDSQQFVIIKFNSHHRQQLNWLDVPSGDAFMVFQKNTS